MALVKCPECGKDMSDRADACPGCGCPLPLAMRSGVVAPNRRSTEGLFLRVMNVMTGCLLTLFGLVAAVVLLSMWRPS